MSQLTLTESQISSYHNDGYLVVEHLLNEEEVSLLRDIARADRELRQQVATRNDGEGGAIDLVVQNDLPVDTIYGAIVRSRRIVDPMQALLDDEVYHYHHKMILKEPLVGGAWAWHQDYGYWYNNGCLFPHLASCMIAVDQATVANGCLQVLKGSHLMGRIEHERVGDQTGASLERVEVARQRLELVHCEMEAGSAVFFHCNLLHRSDQNKSEKPRWAFICCYNARSNDPYIESRHPRYSPLEIWPDNKVIEIGRAQARSSRSSPGSL